MKHFEIKKVSITFQKFQNREGDSNMEDKFKKTEYILYTYKDIDKLNRIDRLKIKQLENNISIGGGNPFEEKGSRTYKFNSSVENEVIKREQYDITSIKNNLTNRELKKQLVDAALDLLLAEDKQLIELRYFSKPTKQWTNVAAKLCMSYDNCQKKRRTIIQKLAEYIN